MYQDVRYLHYEDKKGEELIDWFYRMLINWDRRSFFHH